MLRNKTEPTWRQDARSRIGGPKNPSIKRQTSLSKLARIADLVKDLTNVKKTNELEPKQVGLDHVGVSALTDGFTNLLLTFC